MRSAAIVLALLLAGSAFAHGGEDHGDAAAAPADADETGPRASAASEDFELVALPQDDKLLIYLDRYATNEPVAGAKIEIESGAFKAIATAVGPGIYAVASDAFKTPGRHALTITIETDAKSGGISDLLSATLDVAAPKPAGTDSEVRSPPALAGLGPTTLSLMVAVVLLAIGASAWRRRARAGAEGPTP